MDTRVRKREIVDHDPETATYRATYAYPTEPPSVAVAHAIAAITDIDTTDLEPLHDAVGLDAGALDDLFRPATATGLRRSVSVMFTYYGYEVAVRSYGRIVVRGPPAG